jgi:pimeloyl-ACP methyl ester carboxylesterase
MPSISLAPGTIHYAEHGPADGPVVLFVHGALVAGDVWSDVARDLAGKGWRCVVPTWPLGCHPEAMRPDADLSPPALAELIHAFIAALGLQEVTLVGNDTGGALCQYAVDRDPAPFRALVLTNCDAFDQFPPFPFTLVFALLRGSSSIKILFGQMKLTALRHSPLGFGLLMTRPDPKLTNSWLDPCRSDERIRIDLATLLRHVATTDLTDVSTRFPRFTKPVVLVWGQRDRAFKPSLGRRMAELFGNSSLIEVPDAKTFVSLDDPGSVVDAIAAVGAADASP